MQPRGVYGGSASKISLIVPTHASPRCWSKPVEQAARAGAVVRDGPSARRRRTGRSARPRRSPGGRRRRARAGRRSSAACSRGGRAPASAGPTGVSSRSRTTSQHRLPARRGRAPGAAARSRRPGSAGRPASSPPSRRRPRRRGSRPPSYQKRRLNDARRLLGVLARAVGAAVVAALLARPSRSSRRSALYQSALISTALPRRGVTTQSPTLASIQVSW